MLATAAMGAEHDTETDELRHLFHRLNNQLGIVLANAELLQARVAEPVSRARISQVVESALQAMGTVRELRVKLDKADD
ncbi:MAG: hypothetical protein AB7I50_03905 [Vicinamibacterales bacterium]